MNKPASSLHEERLAAAVEHAQHKVVADERPLVEVFIREYYRQVDPDDLAARSADDLAGAALSQWELGRVRTPGAPRVRVFNPSAAEHGWAVRHTVIEVVNDDMPFLVDSATMEANRQGLTMHLRVHPVYAVERDATGALTGLWPRSDRPQLPRESWMHIEVDRLVEGEARAKLAAGIERVLGDVRVVTADWKKMLARLIDVVAELNQRLPEAAQTEVAETRAFVEWLASGNFLLLGYRCHDLVEHDGEDALKLVAGTGLGVLRETGKEAISASFAALPKGARALAHDPLPLVILTKANSRATVHRSGYVDYVGIKRFSTDGKVIGEHRFRGLLTSTAYSARVIDIPLLRGKVAAVITRAGLAPDSHLGKALVQILESYPRDELFQIGAEELYDNAIGILRLGERQRLRLFIRREPFERFVTCLVFVPRENYGTDLRIKFQDILMNAFADPTALTLPVAVEELFWGDAGIGMAIMGSALAAAGISGNGTPEQEEAMACYGMHLGTAFQIVDDVLDYSGQEGEIGKSLGDDLAEGKPTLPLIHVMKVGNAAQAEVVRSALEQGGREAFPEVIRAVQETGALGAALEVATAEADKAKLALNDVSNSQYKDALLQLASFAVARRH